MYIHTYITNAQYITVLEHFHWDKKKKKKTVMLQSALENDYTVFLSNVVYSFLPHDENTRPKKKERKFLYKAKKKKII